MMDRNTTQPASGEAQQAQIAALLRQARELDMADVRRQIEEQMAADEAARGDDAAAPQQ